MFYKNLLSMHCLLFTRITFITNTNTVPLHVRIGKENVRAKNTLKVGFDASTSSLDHLLTSLFWRHTFKPSLFNNLFLCKVKTNRQ